MTSMSNVDQIARAKAFRDELIESESWLDSGELRGFQALNSSSDKGPCVLRARYRRRYRYPAFQFNPDGSVHAEMAQVLRMLPRPEWAAVFWFFSLSGHLQGRRPADVYPSDPEAVVAAAEKDFVRRDDEW